MEPADQRRDDFTAPVFSLIAGRMPQWSPPINGGMTSGDQVRGPAELPAAMEPADQRRDDWAQAVTRAPKIMPQWSPPINGGMTQGA